MKKVVNVCLDLLWDFIINFYDLEVLGALKCIINYDPITTQRVYYNVQFLRGYVLG